MPGRTKDSGIAGTYDSSVPNQFEQNAARLRRSRAGVVLAISLALLVVIVMVIYYFTPAPTGPQVATPVIPADLHRTDPDSSGIVQPIKDTAWYNIAALVIDFLTVLVSAAQVLRGRRDS
nr:hypothetical protein GCM10020063_084840 [Dactylosporangium thailandense]